MRFEKLTAAALLILGARAIGGQAGSQPAAVRYYELIRNNDVKGLNTEVQQVGVDQGLAQRHPRGSGAISLLAFGCAI